MRQIFVHQYCTRYFKDFCIRTFCNEAIFFWLDVENYKNLPGSQYMKRIALKIYRKYIQDEAFLQINISSNVRADISRKITDPSRCIFNKAQDEIFKLMETDSFPKFLLSKEYEIMSQSFENEEKLHQNKLNSNKK